MGNKEDFEELLCERASEMGGFLEQIMFPPVLIGGCALAAYGISNDTLDIDFLIDCGLEPLHNIISHLKRNGYRLDMLSEESLSEGDLVAFRCFMDGVQFDLIPTSTARLKKVYSQGEYIDWRGAKIRTARLVDVVTEKIRMDRTFALKKNGGILENKLTLAERREVSLSCKGLETNWTTL